MTDMDKIQQIRPKQFEQQLHYKIKANEQLQAQGYRKKPQMVWGPPGVGKSEIMYQQLTTAGYKVYEMRANLYDPIDVRGGIKIIELDNGTYRTVYGTPEDLPPSDTTEKVALLIDELPQATRATMNAFLQVTLDGAIGQYTLPIHTQILAGGNRAEDRTGANEMPTALKNRFDHYSLMPSAEDCIHYLRNKGITEDVCSFLRFKPNLCHQIDHTQYAFPTPRTWENIGHGLPLMMKEIKDMTPAEADGFMHYAIASKIGDGPAGEFIAFCKDAKQMPDLDDLIADPKGTPVPNSMSVVYSTVGALINETTDKTIKSISKWIKKLETEMQVVYFKDLCQKDKDYREHEVVEKWIDKNAGILN